MRRALRFYLTPVGRLSRKALWLAVILPLIGLTIIVAGIDTVFWPGSDFSIFGTLYTPASFALTIAVFWPSFATAIRRFHDLNTTGWWMLACIPIYLWTPDFSNLFGAAALSSPANIVWIFSFLCTLAIAIIQLFFPGTKGENRFGPDPLLR